MLFERFVKVKKKKKKELGRNSWYFGSKMFVLGVDSFSEGLLD